MLATYADFEPKRATQRTLSKSKTRRKGHYFNTRKCDVKDTINDRLNFSNRPPCSVVVPSSNVGSRRLARRSTIGWRFRQCSCHTIEAPANGIYEHWLGHVIAICKDKLRTMFVHLIDPSFENGNQPWNQLYTTGHVRSNSYDTESASVAGTVFSTMNAVAFSITSINASSLL